jgi:alpha-tubulin suppressor-like RCC1 family protein
VYVSGGQVYNIADGTTFLCLAKTRFVHDDARQPELTAPTSGDAVCNNNLRTAWIVAPASQGGNVPNNTILRDPSGQARLVNSVGEIQNINDGGTYLCLATTTPVIWDVPATTVFAWTPMSATPASCGSGGSLVSWSSVVAGSDHTCALSRGGAVYCWGANWLGQLGNGSTIPSSVPVAVSGLSSGVISIASGAVHTCALTTSGTVMCWGDNADGQHGDGTTSTSLVPVQVLGLASPVSLISAEGGWHTCAIESTGRLVCWGSNHTAELGSGLNSQAFVASPVPVVGLSGGVVSVHAGVGSTCAITTGGSLACWGYAAGVWTPTPVRVPGLETGVVKASAGNGFTCAIRSGGAVTCWGSNAFGNLGNGSNTPSPSPQQVTGLQSGVTAISSAGYNASCAVSGLKEP